MALVPHMKEQMIMDLNKLIDALLKDIEAEARQAEAQAKANGERITSSKAHKRAIDTMIEGTERK